MHLVNEIGKYYFSTRVPAILSFIADAVTTQQRVMSYLTGRAKDTEFGRIHHFAEIKNYNDFKSSVPLHDYDSLKPFFQRMQLSEPDVLWPGTTRWFAKSSGTTDDISKFIPLSDEGLHQSHIKTGKDYLSLYLRNNSQSKFFTGKGIVMGGAGHPNDKNPNVFVGDVSAILMKNLDTWIQYFREPSLKVALMPRWEEKLDSIASVTMRQNVTNISGVPSWTLLLLKKVLEKTGKDQIKDVWPNLEFYCHGGVGFEPYRQQYEKIIGTPIYYQNVYNASEGFFAWQDTLDCDDMLLHLDNGVFYEFIPFDGTLREDQVVSIADVKTGVNYAMVISTNSGLWRYLIGDTIEFTSTSPYRIRITGRTKQFINVWGEEVTVNNTDKALAMACTETGSVVCDYTVAPVFSIDDQPGRHEWGIEFTKAPDDVFAFSQLLDRNLQSLNSDYQAKRAGDLAMNILTVSALSSGTFYAWMRSKDKLGSQHKIPRLKNDRKMMLEIQDISGLMT